MKKFFGDFKKFAFSDNAFDLAIGVIVASAFNKLVSSFVYNLMMPLVGAFVGGVDFSKLYISINKTKIMYGEFINSTIDFLVMAFCVFIAVKFINKIRTKKEEKPDQAELLKEIRDILKSSSEK